MTCDIRKELVSIQKIRLVAKNTLQNVSLPFSKPRKDDALGYVLSGSCLYTLENGEQLFAEAGSLIYVSKGIDYKMDVMSAPFSYYTCNFSFAETAHRQCFVIKPKQGIDFEHLFLQLHKTFATASLPSMMSCLAILHQIYAIILESATSRYISGTAKQRIETAKQHLLSRITDPDLRVSQLAADAEMSDVHFRKLFSDLYGISPAKYITKKRVAYAQKLMELPELRLEDIALESGFRSFPYFCKVFKKATGKSPAVFRRKFENEKNPC